mmetsp:Transcript_22104/g.61356  ORF Transcript_22104/g.61356 Transcript_22104/m.61356 type:complete len:229 (-) Transcript_22104:879-1565(-)
MAQDRDLCVGLDVLHQRVGAAGDDEVDDVVQGKQVVDALAACHEADQGRVDVWRQGLGDDAVEAGIGVCGLLAALEEEAVARADCQRSNLREGIWAGLKDDEANANGGGHPLKSEPLGNLQSADGLPDGLLLGSDSPHTRAQLLDLVVLQLEPLHERTLHTGLLAELHILGVGSHDLLLCRLQSGCDALQDGLPGCSGKGLQLPASCPGSNRSSPCLCRLGISRRCGG